MKINIKKTGYKNKLNFSHKQINCRKNNNLLLNKLNKITGIKNIIIKNNFISITKDRLIKWRSIKGEIIKNIVDSIILFNMKINRGKLKYLYINIEVIIVKIINKYIKKSIEKDRGNIEYQFIKYDVLYILIQGNCIECPNAINKLRYMIKKKIKENIKVKSIIIKK